MGLKVIIEYTHNVNNYLKSKYKKAVIREFKDSDSITDETVQESIIEITDGDKSYNEITSIQLI